MTDRSTQRSIGLVIVLCGLAHAATAAAQTGSADASTTVDAPAESGVQPERAASRGTPTGQVWLDGERPPRRPRLVVGPRDHSSRDFGIVGLVVGALVVVGGGVMFAEGLGDSDPYCLVFVCFPDPFVELMVAGGVVAGVGVVAMTIGGILLGTSRIRNRRAALMLTPLAGGGALVLDGSF